MYDMMIWSKMSKTNTNIWLRTARKLYISWVWTPSEYCERNEFISAQNDVKTVFFVQHIFIAQHTFAHTKELPYVLIVPQRTKKKRELSRDESAVPPTACKRAVREWKSHSEEDEKFYLKFFLLRHDTAHGRILLTGTLFRLYTLRHFLVGFFFRRYRVGEFVDSTKRRWTLVGLCESCVTGVKQKKMLIGNWIVMIKSKNLVLNLLWNLRKRMWDICTEFIDDTSEERRNKVQKKVYEKRIRTSVGKLNSIRKHSAAQQVVRVRRVNSVRREIQPWILLLKIPAEHDGFCESWRYSITSGEIIFIAA